MYLNKILFIRFLGFSTEDNAENSAEKMRPRIMGKGLKSPLEIKESNLNIPFQVKVYSS